MSGLLILQIAVYSFTLWLGLYLIARDRTKLPLMFTGFGLVTYAMGLMLDSLRIYAPDIALIEALHWPLRFGPALLWYGASAAILPENQYPLVEHYAGRVSIIGLLLLYVLSLVFHVEKGSPIYWTAAAIVVVRLLIAVEFVRRSYRAAQSKRPLAVLLTVVLFFAISAALFIFPIDIFPADWVLFSLGIDMLLLGGSIGFLDAFDEGETLLPDLLHSFTISFMAVILFAGQVLWAMSWNQGITFPMLTLLFAIIAAAIATQVFSSSIQLLIDRLVFARFARLRRARADLRATADALSRVNEAFDLNTVAEDEFIRLTRRALSHMNNPGKLAASPLTRLPLIEKRLMEHNQTGHTLERAAELKILLSESISRLRPRDKGEFGTSDEWRYYNALYYPYVLGLKPYSISNLPYDLDSETRIILDWMRRTVPERTLHNWQNAAARLVAQDLFDQTPKNGSNWQSLS